MGVSTSMNSRASSWRRRERNDARARDEDFADVGVRDQVEISLAISRLHVFEAVPLFRHGEQRLAEELQLFGVNAEFAGARAEQVAFDAQDVADVEQLEEGEIVLADGIFLDVDLEALAVLLHVRETGLAHVTERHEASGDAHPHLRHELFGGLGAVLREDGGHRVGELVPAAVAAVAQRLDFADARQPLFEQVIFKGQIRLLWRNKLL